MKTKLRYGLPINKQSITRILTESPAHKTWVSKTTGAKYDLSHAIDFVCPAGTPIRAAQDGTVVFVKDGLDKKWSETRHPPESVLREDELDGNHVIIEHAQGEMSIYSHLQKGVAVKKGQKLGKGEVIGKCGNTGWSFGPHLHFMVFRELPGSVRHLKSLEIQWE